MKETLKSFKAKMRKAFGDYVMTEGCSCCQNIKGHEEAANAIGKLLRTPKYSDGSGYDFYKHTTKKLQHGKG
jgi:hypothetical protein